MGSNGSQSMRCVKKILLLILVYLTPCLVFADVGASATEFPGLTHEQLAKRIFEGERGMIAGLRDSHPLLETYLQSLSPNTQAQRPIDDAYFLSKVDFSRSYKDRGRSGYQTFIFGGGREDRKVHVNNGERFELYPDGYLDMLFVDIEAFDADTYDLTYIQRDTWNGERCLMFSVVPRNPRFQGQFKGQIWVEDAAFKIIRIKGTFTPPHRPSFYRHLVGGGNLPLYLKFDSVRQQVAPDTWLPFYTYFDENKTWQQIDRDAETDLRYRGHIFMWGYKGIHAKADTNPANKSDDLAQLEKDRLLANPGLVEQGLNTVVRQILVTNQIDLSGIQCRVLLTTPIEIFHLGRTIILSRGLLNILPDDSVIPVLLAREIGELLLGVPSTDKQAESWKMGLALVERAGYSKGVAYAYLLFTQLAQHSTQVPNLTRARFSRSLVDVARTAPKQATLPLPANEGQPFLLRGKYWIDPATGSLEVRNEPSTNATAKNMFSF